MHFCGLKLWAVTGGETITTTKTVKGGEASDTDNENDEPEQTTSGGTVTPTRWRAFKNEWVTMSSTWKDERIKAWNPVKVAKGFNANMF